MPAQFSTGKQQKPGCATSPSPTRTPSISRAIPQARLDLIAKPSWAWNRENCRWQGRYARESEWPVEELEKRRSALYQDVQKLTRLLEEPPASWDGVKWTEMHHRLKGWEGHLNAIDQTLGRRGTKAPFSGSIWRVGAAPSTSTKAPELDSSDPFAGV